MKDITYAAIGIGIIMLLTGMAIGSRLTYNGMKNDGYAKPKTNTRIISWTCSKHGDRDWAFAGSDGAVYCQTCWVDREFKGVKPMQEEWTIIGTYTVTNDIDISGLKKVKE